MTRLLVGIVVGVVLGSVVSAGASVLLWTSKSRSEKVAYITGIGDGVIFVNNQASGRDIRRLVQYISQCRMTDEDATEIIRIVDQAPFANLVPEYIVLGLARCGGFSQ